MKSTILAEITVGLESPRYHVVEDGDSIEVCAILVNGTSERVISLNVSATSTEPMDFSAETVELKNTTRACVNVPISQNLVDYLSELHLSLTTEDKAVILNPNRATVSIIPPHILTREDLSLGIVLDNLSFVTVSLSPT